MNIKEIVDKIIKETEINSREYSIQDRLDDVHQARLELATLRRKWRDDSFGKQEVESIGQSASDPLTLNKPFEHATILSVGIRRNSEQDYQCIDKAKGCSGLNCGNNGIKEEYSEDKDKVYIWDFQGGDVKITYYPEEITKWTESDYNTGTATPDELPETYHALLWLKPAIKQAGKYSKEKFDILFMLYKDLLKDYEEDLRDNQNSVHYII